MGDRKVTDVMLERIKYFVNAIENGEYKPVDYEFTIRFPLDFNPKLGGQKYLTITDSYSTLEE